MPAGVNGGECMARAGEGGFVPSEARWTECPDGVRELGVGEGACYVSAMSQ